MSIFSKLQSLLTAANTATGESDTTITDAMQTLIDGYGQGGQLVLTKLAEIDIVNGTSLITITATDVMKSCDILYLYLTATLSVSDWIYPSINTGSTTGSYFPTKQTTHTYRYPIYFSKAVNINGATFNKYFGFAGTQGTGTAASGHTYSNFNSITFRPYSNSTTFLSGHIEVWGYV